MSVSTAGAEANGESFGPALSASGRFVAFASDAGNLVEGTPVDSVGVFVRDRDTDQDSIFDEFDAVRTVRIAATGSGADGFLTKVAMSGTGRFVTFSSYYYAEGDANDSSVWFYDRDTDKDGVFDEPGARRGAMIFDGYGCDCGPGRSALDANGRFVVYEDDEVEAIYVWNRTTGRRKLISRQSALGGISATGRFVTFSYGSADLVPGDTNRAWDIFVRDRDSDRDGIFDERGAVRTRRMSLSSAGVQANGNTFESDISSTGRFVIFSSRATSLTPGDMNRAEDVFVRDRDTDRDGVFDEPRAVRTRRVSLSTSGAPGNRGSRGGEISANGRFVAFVSGATNLVPGDTNGMPDVFLRDRDTDHDGIFDERGAVRTELVSISGSGVPGNGRSDTSTLAFGGRFLAFASAASNLFDGDLNAFSDVFVRGPGS